MSKTNPEELGAWYAADPERAATWLDQLTVPWWIAGGWALDLFLNDASRVHTDLDVGVLRRDIGVVLAALQDWDHFEAREGKLTRLPIGTEPRVNVHSLWSRPMGTANWALEFMLDESEGEFWVFRRAPRIRRPLSTLSHVGKSGIRYLAPEIQLLYKAKAYRPKDQADFERVVPRLDTAARSWLRDSLATTLPGHSWLSVLAEFEATRVLTGACTRRR
jgi:hypothetical protein